MAPPPRRLNSACRVCTAQVSTLPSWHGFGLGLRAALTLVRTPLVLVSPHDMEFTREVPLRSVLRLVGEEGNGVE